MPEGLPIKQITIIRIITMSAGVLGSLVMLLEYGFFSLASDQSITLSAGLIAVVGVICFFNLLRHFRTLHRLAKARPASAG
ncbi:MAG TPA: hypothetical protein VD811_02855 [Desulfuromonadales bacterium]|nr:hypothetical protein [Desulfuromonadales bacterium]